MYLGKIEQGDVVVYRVPSGGETREAKCVGLGENKGEVIVNLDDGHWCYLRHDVVEVRSLNGQARELALLAKEGGVSRTDVCGHFSIDSDRLHELYLLLSQEGGNFEWLKWETEDIIRQKQRGSGGAPGRR